MAKRPSKHIACMFCDEVPCVCNVKAKAEPKARKPRKKAEPKVVPESVPSGGMPVTEKPLVSIHEAMRAASKKKAPQPPEIQEVLDDPEMAAAVKAAAVLMGEDELAKWKPVLDAEVEPVNRAALWKERRNVVVE